jgi:hypothetical protein
VNKQIVDRDVAFSQAENVLICWTMFFAKREKFFISRWTGVSRLFFICDHGCLFSPVFLWTCAIIFSVGAVEKEKEELFVGVRETDVTVVTVLLLPFN